MFEKQFSSKFWKKRPKIEKKETIKQKSKERQENEAEKQKILEELIFEKGMSAELAKKEAEKILRSGDEINIDKYLDSEQKKELQN